MNETEKTPNEHKFDVKLPCPSCGERIGFVVSECPFCGVSLPFWNSKEKKIVFGIGLFVVVSYLVAIFYFGEEDLGISQMMLNFGGAVILVALSLTVSRFIR